MSIFDNGEIWPHGLAVFPEIITRGATRIMMKRWRYHGRFFELSMIDGIYSIIDILPDETGLVAMKQYDALEAHILNGDASIRFAIKPLVNARGFDKERLAAIEELEIKNASRSGEVISSWEPIALFHNKTERTDVLEFFGDDGYGDCYYRYDSNTGELLNIQSHPWRS